MANQKIALTKEDIAAFEERTANASTSPEEKEMLNALIKWAKSQAPFGTPDGDWIFIWTKPKEGTPA